MTQLPRTSYPWSLQAPIYAVAFFTDPKVVVTRWPGRTDGREPWD